MTAWAKHFRQHYCLDERIDELRGERRSRGPVPEANGLSRRGGFGPPRSATTEILIADLLEAVGVLGPPHTYKEAGRNESPREPISLGSSSSTEQHTGQDSLS
jgi:hypothetical protein